ncbi:MAG: antibiotic biosynthesis monooxygenase [Gammaproteobacteria bacterium]|nr:antibiotic biosynthesis monooxygenase [Gammaproteobacteria bacterium]MDH5653952.1 antibiotic biosynthesis monooxygenase [Gammaproteobacteria bacterium]
MLINPPAPCYAVIFSSIRADTDDDYQATAERMLELAAQQDGFLGVESVRDSRQGITISYWRDQAAITAWREHAEHRLAREAGREKWYRAFQVRICKVERSYGFPVEETTES